MRFSIITVTYNAEKYLEETLESVAAQSFEDFEHIIWDGGSTDRTVEIAKSFPHITLHQGKDHGIADAMNKGASFAKGDFLIHLHADDRLSSPETLAQLATTLSQHPQCEWLYGRVNLIDQAGKTTQPTKIEPFSIKRIRKYNFIPHPAVAISRKLFEEVGGFDPSLKYCMDYDLWLRLSCKTTPLPLTTIVSDFREHPASLSTSEPLNVADEAYQVRERYLSSPLEKFRSYRSWKKRRKRVQNLA